MQDQQKMSTTQAEQTQLDNILERLSASNSKLVSSLRRLDEIGHKIKNTNFSAETACKSEAPNEPDGTLQQIDKQLDFYSGHNYFLESIIEKFSKLL